LQYLEIVNLKDSTSALQHLEHTMNLSMINLEHNKCNSRRRNTGNNVLSCISEPKDFKEHLLSVETKIKLHIWKTHSNFTTNSW